MPLASAIKEYQLMGSHTMLHESQAMCSVRVDLQCRAPQFCSLGRCISDNSAVTAPAWDTHFPGIGYENKDCELSPTAGVQARESQVHTMKRQVMLVVFPRVGSMSVSGNNEDGNSRMTRLGGDRTDYPSPLLRCAMIDGDNYRCATRRPDAVPVPDVCQCCIDLSTSY